jgi:hypothetical protein
MLRSFMPDLERPTVPFLYKYGSGEHLEWLQPILLQHQVYFPSPPQLNDPKDARPRMTVSSKEGALRSIVNPFLAVHARDPPEVMVRDVRTIVNVVASLDLDRLARWVTPSFHEEMEQHRIYSMTTRPDNEYLWTHYAGDHTGYCLEFLNRGAPFGFARTVIYGDEVVIDFSHPEAIDATFLFRKTRRYEDEEEVRILLLPRGQPHEVAFDPQLLRRVILGRNMSEDRRATIRGWSPTRVFGLTIVDEIAASEVIAPADA